MDVIDHFGLNSGDYQYKETYLYDAISGTEKFLICPTDTDSRINAFFIGEDAYGSQGVAFIPVRIRTSNSEKNASLIELLQYSKDQGINSAHTLELATFNSREWIVANIGGQSTKPFYRCVVSWVGTYYENNMMRSVEEADLSYVSTLTYTSDNQPIISMNGTPRLRDTWDIDELNVGNGASGSFTASSGETVTVTNGIVTGIS